MLNKYIFEILPEVFSEKNFIERFWCHIWKNHLFLRILKNIGYTIIGKKSSTEIMLYNLKCDKKIIEEYEKNKRISNILDIIHAITILSLSCFILALLYDFQYPTDDGTCSMHLEQENCLDRKLLFDNTETYCKWIKKKFSRIFKCDEK
jgi:hypothetical protein